MSKLENSGVTELRLIQLIQLKLLKEVDRVANDLGLEYFLIAGSLLGAVRHKGFIPWDSDADICMLRKDYIKLVRNFDLFDEAYFFQCDETDEYSKIGFARLRMKNTLFIEKGNVVTKNGQNDGFYIDIFPLDNDVEANKYVQLIRHKIYKYFIRLKAFKSGKKKSSSSRNTIISFLICAPMSFLPKKKIIYLTKAMCSRYADCETTYVNNYNSKYGLTKQFMPISTYLPSSKIEFEGLEFSAPNEVHIWLKRIYGDYMSFPKRQMSYTQLVLENYTIDFGDFKELVGLNESAVRNVLNI